MLLSIVIPTYNRANYLDENLKALFQQISQNHVEVLEVIVIDNNSTDNTAEVANHFIKKSFKNFRYIKNPENIGLDGNITKAYKEAGGDFVLILGDDDILMAGALDKIISILKKHPESGVIYINHFGFKNDCNLERPKVVNEQYSVYFDLFGFVRKVNYYFTFVSGNIINKKITKGRFDIDRFLGTNLNLLSWTFAALKYAPYNVYVHDLLLAMKIENTGGYGFCETFGRKGNQIFEYYATVGLDKKYFNFIKNKLLTVFFPSLIRKFKSQSSSFKQEDYFQELFPLYKNNIRFWIFCAPYMVLPDSLGTIYFQFNKVFNKLNTMINNRIEEVILKKRNQLKEFKF